MRMRRVCFVFMVRYLISLLTSSLLPNSPWQAWVVDGSSLDRLEPEIHVPEPEAPQFLERNGPALVTVCGVIICSAVARYGFLGWHHAHTPTCTWFS